MFQSYRLIFALSLVMAISFSACTLRSNQSYSTQITEAQPIPAAEVRAESSKLSPAPALEANGQPAANPPTSLITVLKDSLAQQLGIPRTNVNLQTATATTWRDSCLGVVRPDEMCAQVITPGYRIILQTPTGTYAFHTNQTGQSFRQVPVEE